MSVVETEMEMTKNILPLFGRRSEDKDPLKDLLLEGMISLDTFIPEKQELAEKKERKIVGAEMFPDQSIYILNQQLGSLKESLDRIKFYLGDLEDLLPR